MQIDDIKGIIRKYAVKNVIDYGKADMQSVLGKVIREAKGADINALKIEVQKAIDAVNRMPRAELEREYANFSEEFEQKAKSIAEKNAAPKMIIEGAEEGKVVTRFPPEPGGYVHIGNIKQCILSDEFAKIYKGKIYLYFDDTNPEKCKQEYVDGIKSDTSWLGIKFSKEYYASDYIEKVYDAGRKLLAQGDAYVCSCSDEEVKKGRMERLECKHRQQKPEQNLALFEEMLNGKYEENQVIVRFTGDMSSDNTTLRDSTLFRIKKALHYRQGGKYVVWPTYHINTMVLDNLNGVTDVIRGKEYEIWGEANRKMLASLGLSVPRLHYEARLKINGTTTAKRDIRAMIKDGVVSGWDDPRLVTIVSLRRRGIQPGAIRNFVLRFGMSKNDGAVSIDMLLAENKKIIDPIAKHMFFVEDPVKVTVKGAKAIEAKIKLHPSSNTEFREYKTGEVFYISKSDADLMKQGDTIKLKDLLAMCIVSKGADGIEAEEIPPTPNDRIVQWVSDKSYVECSVIIPGDLVDGSGNVITDSLKVAKGYAESYTTKLKAHDMVQFERFGYCALDKEKPLQFIFTCK